MKNITISVDDDLWKRIHDSAATEKVSMNAFIKNALSRVVRTNQDSAAERFANLAEEYGPAPKSWTWNRAEIYEEAI